MFDGEAFGNQMVEIVKGHFARELEPLKAENASLRARVEELEKRELVLPEKGDIGERGEKGEQGPAGRDADMDAIKQWIEDGIATAVEALPAPERGEAGERGQDGEKGADGAAGADGKDGVGLADALIDKDGNLILTMTDGRTKSLGQVNGKDGKDGEDGETFTIEDFAIEQIDERSFVFCLTKGDFRYSTEVSFPVVIDRGVWKSGEQYAKGDGVTWGGSWWIAQSDEPGKPDTKDSGWRLAVKKGRDGRDAK